MAMPFRLLHATRHFEPAIAAALPIIKTSVRLGDIFENIGNCKNTYGFAHFDGVQAEIKVMENLAYSQAWRDRTWKETYAITTGNAGPVGANFQPSSQYGVNPCNDETYYHMYDQMAGTTDYDELCRMAKEIEFYAMRNLLFLSLAPHTYLHLPYQPWAKGHQGLYATQGANLLFKYARMWLDQDLKYKLKGIK
jgi:hypothetical protein